MTGASPRHILVTGGCGFIGSSLVALLSRSGLRIRVLDDLSSGREEWLREAAPSAELQRGDIRDAAAVTRALEGVDGVVHLAASAGVPRSVECPLDDFDINARGTLVVLDSLRRAGVRRFVLASSNAAMGQLGGAGPRPANPYGAGKLAGEGYVSAFHACYGIETLAVRFANVYGPFSTHKTSVVARFIDATLSGKPLTIYGDGRQTRDFIHVDDICRGLVLALDCAAPAGRVVQAGSGVQTSVLELVETFRRVSGRPVPVVHEPPRKGDIERSVSDLSAAREVLGYAPSVPLEEGVRRTLAWFTARR